jgi:hypothetical protein
MGSVILMLGAFPSWWWRAEYRFRDGEKLSPPHDITSEDLAKFLKKAVLSNDPRYDAYRKATKEMLKGRTQAVTPQEWAQYMSGHVRGFNDAYHVTDLESSVPAGTEKNPGGLGTPLQTQTFDIVTSPGFWDKPEDQQIAALSAAAPQFKAAPVEVQRRVLQTAWQRFGDRRLPSPSEKSQILTPSDLAIDVEARMDGDKRRGWFLSRPRRPSQAFRFDRGIDLQELASETALVLLVGGGLLWVLKESN